MKQIYRKLMLSLALCFVLLLQVGAWSWLYVQDPRTWTKYGQGSVDEATLTIEPKGLYMECNLYLTLSARGNEFSSSDTLEITYYFSLPEKAIMHDSYLWVGDSMVQARLLDRWSAWQIYESIVKRRSDPSVLYKDWSNYYHLQVYPLQGNSTRKVRMTFLLPTRWTSRNVLCPLPLDLLTASKIPVDKLTLLVKENEEFSNPALPTLPGVGFTRAVDPDFGPCRKASIPGEYLGYNQTRLSFSTPLKDGAYLSKLDEGNKGLYQMAVMPSKLFGIEQPKKLLFLIDFDKQNSYYTTGNQVYAELRSLLLNYLDEHDQFNIILSGPQPRLLSSEWIKGDPASVQEALTAWSVNPVDDFSDIGNLLKKGYRFTRSHGSNSSLVLLTNSDHFGNNDTANILFNELKNLGPLPVTHVVDFNESYNWYYFGNRYFRGNEYLYTLLTRYTKGNYYQFNYWSSNISDIMEPVFQVAGGTLSSYDIHTRLEDGFCFGRYELEENENVIYLDKPILQIGSYNGSFPFVVEMAGMYKGEPIALAKKISWQNAYASDSLLKKMWAGNYIEKMQKTWTWDNELISEIIDMSLKNRVLSNYTAFLALEPGMDSLFNEDPGNPNGNGNSSGSREGLANDDLSFSSGSPGKTTEVLAMIQDSIRARVYPNPFHNRTRIELSLGDFQVRGRIQMVMSVYDVTGKEVAIFNPEEFFFNGHMSIDWDGRDSNGKELPRGIYYFNVKTSTFSKLVRLIKL